MTLHCSITYDAFIFIAESCICRNLGITVYKDSNTLATIQHWCILFLPGRSGQKSNVWCMLQGALPTHPINQCEPVQQSRQQVLRAYCPNIYILCYMHTYIHYIMYVNTHISFRGVCTQGNSIKEIGKSSVQHYGFEILYEKHFYGSCFHEFFFNVYETFPSVKY